MKLSRFSAMFSLAAAAAAAFVVTAAGPAEARRGRGHDDGPWGHRSKHHHMCTYRSQSGELRYCDNHRQGRGRHHYDDHSHHRGGRGHHHGPWHD